MPVDSANPYVDDEVLIIDDEPTELFVISTILKNAGIKIRTSNDSLAGLRSAIGEPPSLVLLDWTMPGVSGLEICKTLQGDPSTRGIPVVFCTGISDTDSMLDGFDAGAVDFIRKPFIAGEVVARVKVHLDLRRTRTALERTITGRKHAEESLLKSELALKEAQRVAKIGSWHWDASANFVTWSDELYKIYDLDPAGSPLDSETDQKHYTPESAARLLTVVQKAIQTGEPYAIELQRYISNGTLRWILARGEVLRDADGSFFGLCGTAQDITDRKNAEETLQRSKAQLSIAVELARLGPWEYDIAADRFTFNDQFYRIFRTTAGAMGGYTMSSADYTRRFVHPESAGQVGAETLKAIETDDPYFNRQLEHRIIYADGSIGYISVCFFVVKDDSGRTVKTYGVNQDITERKQAEEERRKFEQQLFQAQKLDSLGILAGGIAHDFNNLLGGIFGYMDLAHDASDPNGKAAEYLSKSLKTYARAKDLTQQLLTFAKGGAPALTTGSVVPLLKDTTQFAMSGSKVSCVFDINDNLGQCEFDENQMGQVIDNIVINAVQAMPLGGMLTVAAKNVEIAEGESVGCKAGRYIRCDFTDTGIGIPADIIPRIFDPFFTTKQKGNGLGLATAYSIVHKHHGDITVKSEPGKGTTFTILLPVSQKRLSSRKTTADNRHRGSGIILIMDDEDYIREIVGEMAQSMGYTAEYASHGQEVLDLFRAAAETGKNYAAVIMDLTIPGGRGGRETIEELRNLCGVLPVFVASGYSDDPVMADPAVFGFTDKIGKPFRTEELRKLFSRHLPPLKQL